MSDDQIVAPDHSLYLSLLIGSAGVEHIYFLIASTEMRVAIIHYWLVGMRGGEKVIEALCRMYPQADIFTHAYDPTAVSSTISAHRVQTSFISRLPRATRAYKRYLPLMPMALEQFDLRGYDLILSSESGPS